jgi:hypothetical protein
MVPPDERAEQLAVAARLVGAVTRTTGTDADANQDEPGQSPL